MLKSVRTQVWDQVWRQVRDQVRHQVWDQVSHQVWDQVRDQVWDQVWDQVRAQVQMKKPIGLHNTHRRNKMTKTPYEIRFDLLAMAKDLLDRQYEQSVADGLVKHWRKAWRRNKNSLQRRREIRSKDVHT
jgi:hypothetical protein